MIRVGAREVTVSHRPIAGYMPAMTMPFAVRDPRELEQLSPGSRIRFKLTEERGQVGISRIRRLPGDNLDVPAPPEALRPGQPMPNASFFNQDGHAVRLHDWRGKVVALQFLYTRCPLPNVCPRQVATFAALQRRFRDVMGDRLVLASVTLDPRYDTSGVMADYAKLWHAGRGWQFLSGAEEAIRMTASAAGVVYWPEEGVLAHSTATLLVSPDGTLAARVEGSAVRVDQLGDLIAAQLEGFR